MRPSMIKWKAVKFQRVQKSRKVNIGQSNQESLSEKRFELRGMPNHYQDRHRPLQIKEIIVRKESHGRNKHRWFHGSKEKELTRHRKLQEMLLDGWDEVKKQKIRKRVQTDTLGKYKA